MAAFLYWPLRNGHAYLDDFLFLALARHIDDPLWLLTRDSTGLFFFRPVGMFVSWLTVEAFGDRAPLHMAFNVALHALNGVLLHAVARRMGIATWPAAIVAVLFVAHPAAFAASAWIADRFDLLALAFSLLSMLATLRLRSRCSAGNALLVAAALLAAMLSKESGFAAPVACALLFCLPGADGLRGERRALLAALTFIAVLTLAALAWRSIAIRGVGDVMFFKDGVAPAFMGGFWRWLTLLPPFFFVNFGNPVAVVAWAAALLAALALLIPRAARSALRRAPAWQVILLAVVFATLTALAQAPVVKSTRVALFMQEGLAFDALGSCRFFYLPLAGLALAFTAIAQAIGAASTSRGFRAGVALLAGVMLAASIVSARAIGREWAAFPLANGERELQLMTQVTRGLTDATPGCKIYFLEVPARAEPALGLLDVGVKKSLPREHPAAACFISSEHTPWYHMVPERLGAGAGAPLSTMVFAGKPFAPLRVANLAYHYLDAADARAIAADPAARFFGYRDGAFAEVTEAVRSGSLKPRFHVNRVAF